MIRAAILIGLVGGYFYGLQLFNVRAQAELVQLSYLYTSAGAQGAAVSADSK